MAFRSGYLILLLICLLEATKAYPQRIDSLMKALHERGQFDGAILVSQQGATVYRSAFGTTLDGTRFTPTTQANIASLSKGFTAMCIMMLVEEGKIHYDDPIVNFLPELKTFSNGITVRHLLTHTSGIPDVGDLGIDNPKLTNEKALKTLAKLPSNFRDPGQRYEYSNTGYLLLGTIVERISRMKFADFLADRILDTLDMRNTYVSGRTVGMGGMVSTVDDLSKWDESFYTEKLVHRATLHEAFTAFPVREGTSTYGFGWNIGITDGGQFIWHTGNAEGYRAFVGRMVLERIAVIMLTAGDSKRMEISAAIVNVLHGKSFVLPPMPIEDLLYEQIHNRGIEQGVHYYDSLRRNDFRNFDFGESQLNSLGYRLLTEKKYQEAIAIFDLNTTAFPKSSNAFDSLAEAYHQSGDNATAIRYYEKALELDPENLSSINQLKKIRK